MMPAWKLKAALQLLKGKHASGSPTEETLTCARLFAMQHPSDWLQRQKILANTMFEVHVIRKIANYSM